MSVNKELIKELKKQGQTIKPILFIGKNEITDTVYEAILLALKARELIKVKIQQNVEVDLDDLETRLNKENAYLVQKIGRTLLLYRKKDD